MRYFVFITYSIFVCLSGRQTLFAQELFPYAEAASTLPLKTFSYRIGAEFYQDLQGNPKRWVGIRGMYGITRLLTATLSVSGSNHHVKNFPNGYAAYFLNHHTGFSSLNPFLLEGVHGMLKYRMISVDGFKRHIRIAIYGEGSINNRAHDEAEPNLYGDNAGVGAGLIITGLYQRWALSLTSGGVKPKPFVDKPSALTFTSGNMFLVNGSIGYLLFPRKYKDYGDLNLVLYTEVIYRNYGSATLQQKKNVFDLTNFNKSDQYTYNSLQANEYIDVRTTLQIVSHSQSRWELGCVWKLWNQSYVHTYPLLVVNYQRYFFSRSKLIPKSNN